MNVVLAVFKIVLCISENLNVPHIVIAIVLPALFMHKTVNEQTLEVVEDKYICEDNDHKCFISRLYL